ncbi:reverse transcriptase domain-containing protein, partial [Tanacetum coccineum]
GVSSLKGVGVGLVLIDTTVVEYTYDIRLNFPNTNNEAEYEALLAGLRITRKIKVWAWKVKVDSKLVACQLNGEFVASNKGMTKYLTKAKEQMNTAVAHPQANGLVKQANKSLMHGFKARLGLERIGMPTYRTIQFNEALNEEEMWLNLDLIQERRETTAIREATYKKKVEQYYNKRVRPVSFKVKDFVYRKNEASRVENQGKLGPN